MTGFKRHFRGRRRAKPFALPVVTVVCLILLALLTVVQVAHVHPVDTDADHCPLCIMLHSAAPIAVAAAVIVLVQVESRAPVYEACTITRYWHSQLFIRPPPAGR